jgi:hypothetical protein
MLRTLCHLQAIALIGEFNNWDPKPEHWCACARSCCMVEGC